MCYCQNRAVGKLAANRRLNQLVRFHVDRSRSLVQHEDGSFAEQGACQTHKLSLPDTDKPQCGNTNIPPVSLLRADQTSLDMAKHTATLRHYTSFTVSNVNCDRPDN